MKLIAAFSAALLLAAASPAGGEFLMESIEKFNKMSMLEKVFHSIRQGVLKVVETQECFDMFDHRKSKMLVTLKRTEWASN